MTNAVSSEDNVARVIAPVDKGVNARLLEHYTELRQGNEGTIVLIDRPGKGESCTNPGLYRLKTLLELGRLGIENLFIRTSEMGIRKLNDTAQLAEPQRFVRSYFAQPHEPSSDELDFFAKNHEEVLYRFLWPAARLLPCCNARVYAKKMVPLFNKMCSTDGHVNDVLRQKCKTTWAELVAKSFNVLPQGAAGVHIHSAGYREHILRRLDAQDRRFSVYYKSMR